MFPDQARIHIKAGNGGRGIVAFRREKFIPRGGPSGGNGGKGGDVYFEVDHNLNTLLPFRNQVQFKAEAGVAGGGKDMTGAKGADLTVPVPPGTLVLDEFGKQIADLTTPGQRLLMARGGRGGRGNASFATSSNKAPRIAENGEPGQEMWLRLELKLIADVGIVGVPNAGKSTLLSVISAAKPKIADYAFTTLEPNLGAVQIDDRALVFADIPGLIEGAHSGIGLGTTFLRHIERTRAVIHLLNGASPDPLGDYEAINTELELFNPGLRAKPQVVAFNKMDLPEAQAAWPQVREALAAQGVAALSISAVTHEGVNDLLRHVVKTMDELPPIETAKPDVETVFRPAADEHNFTLEREAPQPGEPPRIWRVRGQQIERAALMTKWEYYEAGVRFQRILEATGVEAALEAAGVQDGDLVRIANAELTWGEQDEED